LIPFISILFFRKTAPFEEKNDLHNFDPYDQGGFDTLLKWTFF